MLNRLKSNLLDHECIVATMKVLSNLNYIGATEAFELKNFIASNKVHKSCDETLLTDVTSVLETKSI